VISLPSRKATTGTALAERAAAAATSMRLVASAVNPGQTAAANTAESLCKPLNEKQKWQDAEAFL
jgi:hypothetical protein